eukprot:TRINITY_DN5156_c0_g1_i1.p1 TRINITY_DN5156_c0_g1~~TRINITY_DN5156_c0_g1_i1.p1  ORF type:complete len:297 (+),score=78.69 TRINITY_DN5156_c0_g1_i1:43-933(+)
MDSFWVLLDSIIDPVSSILVALKPTLHDEKHFYVSPKQHVFEIIIANIFFGLCIYFGLRKDKSSKAQAGRARVPAKPLHTAERVFRVVLTLNIIMQLVYKTMRGWHILGYMLQPCHVTTCLYLFCWYTSDHHLGARVFQVSVHYMFFTALALAVPDLAQLKLPFEQTTFWVQHWALLIAPILMLLVSRRYHPLTPSFKNSLLAIGLGGLFHFDVQLPLAFVTGVNINYMLWPPPGVPAFVNTPYYRYWLTLALVTLAWLCGHIIVTIIHSIHSRSEVKAVDAGRNVNVPKKPRKAD